MVAFRNERSCSDSSRVDDLDGAERHLRLLPSGGVGVSLTEALRGRRYLLAGNKGAAAAEVVGALEALATNTAQDVGALMNGALALAWSSEVLAELGFGEATAAVVDQARARISEAGIDDQVIEGMLVLAEAEAARLLGETESANVALESVDTSVSPDFAIQYTRTRARLAWGRGDRDAANDLYLQAAVDAESLGYLSLARVITTERSSHPPRSRRDLRGWVEQRFLSELERVPPYAVVVRLAVDDRPERFGDLEEQLIGLLRATPQLGAVDGIGTDGDIWELFLTGDDPDALWAVVRPLVDALRPAPGSEAQIRRGEGLVRVLLA